MFSRPVLSVFFFVFLISLHSYSDGKETLSIQHIISPSGQILEHAQKGQPCTLVLQLLGADGKGLGPADLAVVHEKLFHFFLFDRALENYLHIHPIPENTAGIWQVGGVIFDRASLYHAWADITLAMHSASENGNRLIMTTTEVQGQDSPDETPKFLEPKSAGVDGISKLELLDTDDLKAGKMAMMTLKWSRTDGSQPVITPYLGAMAHILITDLTGEHLIHAHPMDMGGEYMVHTEFPAAGDYRLFIQFNDGNPALLRTVKLAVRVN